MLSTDPLPLISIKNRKWWYMGRKKILLVPRSIGRVVHLYIDTKKGGPCGICWRVFDWLDLESIQYKPLFMHFWRVGHFVNFYNCSERLGSLCTILEAFALIHPLFDLVKSGVQGIWVLKFFVLFPLAHFLLKSVGIQHKTIFVLSFWAHAT